MRFLDLESSYFVDSESSYFVDSESRDFVDAESPRFWTGSPRSFVLVLAWLLPAAWPWPREVGL